MSRSLFRRISIAALVVIAMLASGFTLFHSLTTPVAHAASPEIDVVYANGQTWYMLGATQKTNPSPQMLAHAPALYVLGYPVNGSPTNPTCTANCPSITLASGYQPQCDPCFHPGLPAFLAYHDHVLTGAPGAGADGTAGSYKGPWQIIVLMYSPKYALSSSFQPITSDEALDAAEKAGDFLPINKGAANPFELPTGHVLICPLVSQHA